MLNSKGKILLTSLFSLLFVVLNLLFVSRGNYILFAVPLVIIAVLSVLFAQEYVYWAIVFLTPLSVNLAQMDMGFGIALPTEPLLFALLIFYFIKILLKPKPDAFFLKHPITLSLFFYLFWMFITTLSSQMSLVSFKFFIAHLWFIVPLFFMAYPLYAKSKNIVRFLVLSVISLSIVAVITTLKHGQYAFSEEIGRWIMSPFYNDHTAYGMAMAFFLPVTVGFSFRKKTNPKIRLFALLLSVVLLIALYLSFSRAAWLSVFVSVLVYAFLKLRMGLRSVSFIFLLVLAVMYANWQTIAYRAEKNKTESSENFMEHLKSSANIMSDASNLERINRWNSALRLFKQRPFLGWGPGTYQFVYGPVQRSVERTIISTNSGDAGTAHSEYLGPLAESGFLGMLTVLAVFFSLLYTGFKVYRNSESEEIRFYALISTLAITTYLVHGLLNNFLDSDKAAVPLWTFAAILVALDKRSREAKRIT